MAATQCIEAFMHVDGQDGEGSICTGSLKLDWIGKNVSWSDESRFLLQH